MPAPARAQEYDEDQHVKAAVGDQQRLDRLVGEHGEANESRERQQEQQEPVALELGLAIARERVGDGIEARPARRQREREVLGIGLFGRLRIDAVEQVIQALGHLGAARFGGHQRRRFMVELPGERDQQAERVPGIELAPVRIGQLRPPVRGLDPEQTTDKSEEAVQPSFERAAAIMVDDGASPSLNRDLAGRRALLAARRHDMNHRPDLRSVEAGPRRAADLERYAFPGELDDLGGAADRHIGFITVPDRKQDIAVLGDEQADRAILLGALLGIGAHRLQRVSMRKRHDRGGDGLRQQRIEFGDIARLQAGLEVPEIFLARQRQRSDEPRALCQRHPRHQAIGAFRQGGQDDDRGLVIGAEIVEPQARDDVGDLDLEPGQVLVTQIAMPGHADHQWQAVGQRLHDRGSEQLGRVRSIVGIGRHSCTLGAIQELRRHDSRQDPAIGRLLRY